MTCLPAYLRAFDLKGFTAWLGEQGAMLLDPTNPWEVIRYKAPSQEGQPMTVHIVYSNKSGALNYQGWSNKHYLDYVRGKALGKKAESVAKPEKPKPVKMSRKSKVGRAPVYAEPPKAPGTGKKHKSRREKLLERDGPVCWFCGEFYTDDDPPTIEHLLAKSKGGSNAIENLVLAHKDCNQKADVLSVADKVRMRDALAAKQQTIPPWESVR